MSPIAPAVKRGKCPGNRLDVPFSGAVVPFDGALVHTRPETCNALATSCGRLANDLTAGLSQ